MPISASEWEAGQAWGGWVLGHLFFQKSAGINLINTEKIGKNIEKILTSKISEI